MDTLVSAPGRQLPPEPAQRNDFRVSEIFSRFSETWSTWTSSRPRRSRRDSQRHEDVVSSPPGRRGSRQDLEAGHAGHAQDSLHPRLAPAAGQPATSDLQVFAHFHTIPSRHLRSRERTRVYPLAPIKPQWRARAARVIDVLKRNLENDRDLCDGHTLYSTYLTGASPDAAAPTIIIFGPDDDLSTNDRIVDIVNQPQVREQCTTPLEFRVICLGRSTLAGDSSSSAEIHARPGASLCGAAVFGPGSTSTARLSTVSCIVVCGSRPHAFTSGHPFEDVEQADEPSGSGEMATATATATARPADSTPGTVAVASGSVRRVRPGDTWASGMMPNLDWALMELDGSRSWPANQFSSRPEPTILADRPSALRPSYEAAWHARRVLVLTSQDCQVAGFIRSVPTLMTNWDASRRDLNVFTVVLAAHPPAKLGKGTSGSLVVDCETLQPFGHVVSVNPMGELHVISMLDAFAQIKDVLGVPEPRLLASDWGRESQAQPPRLAGKPAPRHVGTGSPQHDSPGADIQAQAPIGHVGTSTSHSLPYWDVADDALREKWEGIGPRVSRFLEGYDPQPSAHSLSVRFCMVGSHPATAKPSILLLSRDKRRRRFAASALESSGILGEGLGFGVMEADISGPDIRELSDDACGGGGGGGGASDDFWQASGPGDVYTVYRDAAFGRRLFVRASGARTLRPATGGPVLWLDDKPFQLTVKHVYPCQSQRSSDEKGQTRADSGEASASGTIMSYAPADRSPSCGVQNLGKMTLAARGAHGSRASTAPDPNLGSSEASAAASAAGSGAEPDDQAAAPQPDPLMLKYRDLIKIGTMAHDAPNAADDAIATALDYSLVRMDADEHAGSHVIPLGTKWLAVRDPRACTETRLGNVIATTASSEMLRGQLSRVPEWLRLPDQRLLRKVYPLRLQGRLAPGDCGSPVVDRASGAFLGHITAGVPDTGLGYVQAAEPVLEDIERRLGSPVSWKAPARSAPRRKEEGRARRRRKLPKLEDVSLWERCVSFVIDQACCCASANFHWEFEMEERIGRNANYGAQREFKMLAEQDAKAIARSLRDQRQDMASRSMPPPRREHEARLSLDKLLGLPEELCCEILEYLEPPDLLRLRLASRQWNSLIVSLEKQLSAAHARTLPPIVKAFYPRPRSGFDFFHMAQQHRRVSSARQVAGGMAEWISSDWFSVNLRDRSINSVTHPRRLQPCRDRMRSRMTPILLIISYYLDEHRRGFVHCLRACGDAARAEETAHRRLLATLSDPQLLYAHELFPLFVSYCARQFRPPSKYGTMERLGRGYRSSGASDEAVAALIRLGGIHTVARLVREPGYEARTALLDEWFSSIRETVGAGDVSRGHLAETRARTRTRGREQPGVVPRKGKEKEVAGSCRSLDPSSRSATTLQPDEAHVLLRHGRLATRSIWFDGAVGVLRQRGVVGARRSDVRQASQVVDELRSPFPEHVDSFLVGS